MKTILYIWIILALASKLSAQMEARTPTPEDYRCAVSFRWQNLVNKRVFNINIQPVWCGDSSGLGFVTKDRERKYFNIGLECGYPLQTTPAFLLPGFTRGWIIINFHAYCHK